MANHTENSAASARYEELVDELQEHGYVDRADRLVGAKGVKSVRMTAMGWEATRLLLLLARLHILSSTGHPIFGPSAANIANSMGPLLQVVEALVEVSAETEAAQ